jgi:AcrR family transcriptional regulator
LAAQKAAARRAAILAAALDEFSARGFAAARLDDVARRADVAKGTIYLHFKDKEALFQELVRTMLSPLVMTLEQLRASDVPIRVVLERFADLFVREIYGTRRRDVARLVITEGARFFAHLDVAGMMRAHIEILLGPGSEP